MTKVATFENLNIDLSKLYENLKKIIQDNEFKITKDETTEYSYHLQAIKAGVKRIILGATRDVTIVIAGEPDAFAVTASVGAYGKNLAISGSTGLVIAAASGLPGVVVGGLAASGSYMIAKRFELELWEKINEEITKLSKK